jgi:hypothetical protein
MSERIKATLRASQKAKTDKTVGFAEKHLLGMRR